MQVKTRKSSMIKNAAKMYEKSKVLLQGAGIMVISALCACTQVYGGLRPLGLAICAGSTSAYSLPACVGAAIGYAFSMDIVKSSAYLCAIFAIALTKTLFVTKKNKASFLLPPVAGASVLVAVNCLIGITSGTALLSVATSVAEGLIMCGGTYFVREFSNTQNTQEDAKAQIIGWALLVSALSVFNIYGFSLARAAVGVAVLVSKKDRGAISAVCGAVLLALNPANAFAAVGFIVGGLCAGLAKADKPITALCFAAGSITGVIAAQSAQGAVCFVLEIAFCVSVYLISPASITGKAFTYTLGEERRAAASELAEKVSELALSLGDIGVIIGEVFEKLPKKGESYADICTLSADKICKKCQRNMFCWVDCYSDTMSAMQLMEPILRAGAIPKADEIPDILQRRCLNKEALIHTLTKEYEASLSRKMMRTQGEMMRMALTEQYGSIAAALEGFAKALWKEERPDMAKSAKVEGLFVSLGITPLSSRVSENMEGSMHVQVKLPRVNIKENDLSLISDEISDICRRSLQNPVCINTAGYTLLDFYEKAVFEAVFGSFSIAATEGVCADAVRNFCDGAGKAHTVLCDGMGTGKAAAVDGLLAASLTARLIQAGFAPKETARLVNVALGLKSEDEAGATLDILSVNLYTGNANLFKAGAAESYIIHAGAVKRLANNSLPVGIMGNVVSAQDSFVMRRGDIAVLVSDGALAAGDEWLQKQLELTCYEQPQIICKKAAECALRLTGQHQDDITISAMKIM